MRKTCGLLMAVGLVLGTVTASQAARRTLTFYLHYDGTADTCGATYINRVDSADTGNGCGYVAQPANEALFQTGEPLAYDWPDQKNSKFRLDASKPVTAAIDIGDFTGSAPLGQATLDIEITAQLGATTVTLLAQSKTETISPTDSTIEFSGKAPKKLNGKILRGLAIKTILHGVSNGYYIDTDDPPSRLTVSTR